jgi:hypothetical protein
MKTRDRLLDHLRRFGPSRVVDLSTALDLTPADIRYQLKALISAGLVQPDNQEPALARGRPASRFELISGISVESAFFLLELFADQITTELPDLSTDEISSMIWKRIRKKLELSSSPYGKVIQILMFLDSMGVKTSWEAAKSGPNIIVIQNPYQTRINPRKFQVLADSIVHLALQEAVIE